MITHIRMNKRRPAPLLNIPPSQMEMYTPKQYPFPRDHAGLHKESPKHATHE